MKQNSVIDSKLPGALTFIFHHLHEILLMKKSETWFKFHAEQSKFIILKIEFYNIDSKHLSYIRKTLDQILHYL